MKKKRRGPTSEHPASIADAPRKSRGAQPGNRNAYRHGFYSALFKEAERKLLDQVSTTDLSAEIELIRVANARFLQALAASRAPLDFESQLAALRAVNLSAHSIASLLRAQAFNAAFAEPYAEHLRELEAIASSDPDEDADSDSESSPP